MQPGDTETLPPRLWEWGQALLLGANLVATSLWLGGYCPDSWPLSVVLLALTVILHSAGWVTWAGRSGWRVHPAGWWACPFLVYGAANAAWVSPVPWLGWLDWLGWLNAWLVFWVVLNGLRSTRVRHVFGALIIVLCVLGVVLGSYQVFVDRTWLMGGYAQSKYFHGRASGFFGIPNSLAALLLLVLPVTLAQVLRRGQTVQGRVLWGYLVAVFVFGFGLTLSRGGIGSLVVALLVWLSWRMATRRRARWLRLGALVLGLGFGASLAVWFVPSLQGRFSLLVRDRGETSRAILWRAACNIFREAPTFGGGAGAFNTRFESQRPWSFQDEPQWPHNEALNLLADYGVAGAALACVFAGSLWVSCRPRRGFSGADGAHASSSGFPPYGAMPGSVGLPPFSALDDPLVRQGLWVGLGAFALQSNFEFSLKIPALAMLAAVVLAEAVRGAPVVKSESSDTSERLSGVHRWGGFATGVCGIVALAACMPLVRAEALRYPVWRLLGDLAKNPAPASPVQKRLLVDAKSQLERACSLAPSHGQAWADLSYLISVQGHESPAATATLGPAMENAARRALQTSTRVADFWVRLSVALDAQGKWVEGGRAILEALRLAPESINVNFYYAYHFSLRPYTREIAFAVAARCVNLDPMHAPARRLWSELREAHSNP